MGDNGQLHSDTGWEDLMFFETAGSNLYGTAPPRPHDFDAQELFLGAKEHLLL